jgi:hypothetical protein
MERPVRHAAELDPDAWVGGMHTFAQYVSPWLSLVDRERYEATVDRIAALLPRVLAGCHTPMVDGDLVGRAIDAARLAPWADVPPQPDQSVLDAIVAALDRPALEPAA